MDSFDEMLKNELAKTDFELPEDFNQRVIRKIEMKSLADDQASSRIMAFCIGGFVLLGIICLLVFLPKETISVLPTLFIWGAMVGSLITIFQLIEKKLLIRKINPV